MGIQGKGLAFPVDMIHSLPTYPLSCPPSHFLGLALLSPLLPSYFAPLSHLLCLSLLPSFILSPSSPSTGDEFTCGLQLKEAVEKLKETERKFEEAERMKEDAEIKLSEAQRRALSLRWQSNNQNIQHLRWVQGQ